MSFPPIHHPGALAHLARATLYLTMTSLAASTISPQASAHEAATHGSRDEAARVTAEMARAANAFLASLEPEQREQAALDFSHNQRESWDYFPNPRSGEPRAGLPLKEMRADQQQLAYALLASALSQPGYFKAMTIMTLERILWENEGQSPMRDPELYYFAIFGQPGAQKWGWRVEGHHLSVNLTIAGGKVIAQTPTFLGANPAEIVDGPRAGLKTLREEEELARELARSFTQEQAATGILSDEAPREILTRADHKVDALKPLGIGWPELTEPQRELLARLVREYLENYRPELAAADWQRIQDDGVENLHFAWAGGLEPRQGHYYRVQGRHFLLEYDNTQGGANHIHSVWRDFQGDFGRDILREHYKDDH